jgi:hypothetical protein
VISKKVLQYLKDIKILENHKNINYIKLNKIINYNKKMDVLIMKIITIIMNIINAILA